VVGEVRAGARPAEIHVRAARLGVLLSTLELSTEVVDGDRVPIGVALARTAKAASAAFDTAMNQAGGSLSIWLVLLSLKTSHGASQRAMAESMGIQGATLTHHLNGMEECGLVTRRRDPENRRVHIVELTESGEELFERLRSVAVAYDAQLRGELDSAELDRFRRVLDQLGQNVSAGSTASADWAPSARDGD
jgi:MarR family transcriptional regulator for hemolysin